MSSLSLQVEGLAEVERLLGKIETDRVLEKAIDQMTLDVQSLMAAYPPEGDYNRPGEYPKRWYQRHFGPRWMRKEGGYGGRNTSQQLQKSWKRKTTGGVGTIWTNVTYAPYVQSSERQARFHRAHGWKTDRDVLEDYKPMALARLQQHIHDALNGH